MARHTVICALRSGGPYDVGDVHALETMVRRYLPSLDRFVCLTDFPPSAFRYSIDVIAMEHAWPGHWCKVELFDPSLPLDGRILYLDLDVVIQGSLEQFIADVGPFVIASSGEQKPHPRRVAGYNSSVMAWDHGARRQIYEWFRPERVMARYVGDQDWIGAVCPRETTFAPAMVEKFRPGARPLAPVVLCTNPKPKDALDDPFIRDHWPLEREAMHA